MIVGGALLAAAAIGALVLVLTGGDDSDDPPTEAELAQQRAEEIDALLSEEISIGDAGLVVHHPEDWKASKRQNAIINVESPDRCIVVSVSAPASADLAGQLSRDAVTSLRLAFGKVQEQKLTKSEIDGLPTESVLIATRDKKGNPLVVRQGVSKGDRYAYVTQTLFRVPPCEEASPTADLILQNLELSK